MPKCAAQEDLGASGLEQTNTRARGLEHYVHMHNIEAMVPEAMRLLETGDAPRIEQDHRQASYCAKRTPEDGMIDWRLPTAQILTLVRAVGDPYPGAYTCCNGSKLHIDQMPQVERIVFRIGLAAAEILIAEGIL